MTNSSPELHSKIITINMILCLVHATQLYADGSTGKGTINSDIMENGACSFYNKYTILILEYSTSGFSRFIIAVARRIV